MNEEIISNDNTDINEIPGTAAIRKLGGVLTPMELLQLSARMAKEGLDKKLWSVLSRVYADKKSFEYSHEDGMDVYVRDILESGVPAQLKLQAYTSFKLPSKLLPDADTVKNLLSGCNEKRYNIAAHFIDDYDKDADMINTHYDIITKNGKLFKEVVKVLNTDSLVNLFKKIFTTEDKERITGAVRVLGEAKRKFYYKEKDKIAELTDIAFSEKNVFFTSKLLFCSVFNVPEEIVKQQENIEKILKISVNYEEHITKEFVRNYHIKFDISDEAMCRYYIGNKKAKNQRALVNRFAYHLVRIDDKSVREKLLRGAFKRGGAFRMYAGCMQDGRIIPEKMKRFRYSDEEVKWCSSLPGLNNK